MSTLAGNKRIFFHFLTHRPRLVHSSTEKVHQSAYSCADDIYITWNISSSIFEYWKKIFKKVMELIQTADEYTNK